MPIRKQRWARISGAEREQILDAWATGMPIADVAARFDRTEGSIGTIVYAARVAGDQRAAYRSVPWAVRRAEIKGESAAC